MRLIGIVGTNADHSTNRTLLHFIKTYYQQQMTLEICEIKDLPAFTEPEERQAPLAIQVLSEKIKAADGVIIATPEYDHSIPAALKSMMEWLSYTTRPLIDKPVMIVGASYGALGSSRAQAHLRQILDAPEIKARIMPSAEFLLGHSLQAFDEKGQLLDEEKKNELTACITEFEQFVEITKQLVTNQSTRIQQQKKFSWEKL